MKSTTPSVSIRLGKVVRKLLPILLVAGFLNESRLPLYAQSSEGRVLLAYGDLSGAKSSFQESIQDGRELEGRIGLARVFIGQRLWEMALNEIDKAVDIEPSSLEARYYKAIIHREIAKYDVLQAPKHRRRAFSLFEEIASEDSSYASVYFQIGLIHRYLEEYPDAVALALRQLEISAVDPAVHIGLRRMYRHYIEYGDDESLQEFFKTQPYPYGELYRAELDRKKGRKNFAYGRLEQLLASDSLDIPVQPILFELARLEYADRQSEKGQKYVEEAIDLSQTEVEVAFVFEEFKHVLTDVELNQYLRLSSIEEKKAFFRGMWQQRDPMPARTENVRLTEHFRRMLHAEKDYQFFGIRSWHNNPDPAGHLPFPAATYLNEEFNDKGLIYIRYGDPIDRITHVGGPDNFFRTQVLGVESSNWMPSERTYNMGHALNESWRYVEPNLDFHFVVANNEENNWRMIPFLTSVDMLESREHWGDPYAAMFRAIRSNQQMGSENVGNFAFNAELEDGNTEFSSSEDSENAGGASISSASNVRGQAMRFELEIEEARQMMIQQSQEAVEIGLKTDRHTWERDIEPMPIPNMIVSFRGPEGMTELDLYYALPIGKISEVDEGTSSKIPVESGYSVMDFEWNVIDEDAVTRELPRSEDKTAAVVDFYRVTVEPDSYMVALHGLPEESTLMGGYKFGYQVPDYSGDQLNMSDLLLANNVELTLAGQTRFSRNGFKIQSNPFQRYSVNQIVYIYFELYNLSYDGDVTRYDIEYILMPDRSEKGRLFKRRARPILSLKVERTGEMRSPFEYAEFDVRDVDPGKYEMTIRIIDKVTKATVEKSARFELTR